MEKNAAKRGKSTLGKICSIVVDILVIPVIVLAFICTIVTFSAKANNQVPKIFGKSVVTVLTESMEPEYKVGDVLIINSVANLDKLKIGDNIAFYAPVWLSSPFTTTLDNGERVSNVIYHQIVDIVYPRDAQGRAKRHFVCRGTNLAAPEYTFVGEGNGNYKRELIGGVEKFVIAQDAGDYDIVLENMPLETNGDNITTDDVNNSSMSTMQYVTDDLVVGVYDSSLSPAIAGFIRFSSSSVGLLCMVVVPAAIMIAIVVFGLIREIKESKQEEAEDQLVLEGNISALKETSLKAKQEADAEANKEPQVVTEIKPEEEEIDIHSVIGGVLGTKSETFVKQEEPKQGKPQMANASVKVDNNSATAMTSKVAKSEQSKISTTNNQASSAITAKPVAKPIAKPVAKPIAKSAENLASATVQKTDTKTETKLTMPEIKTVKPPVKKVPQKKED